MSAREKANYRISSGITEVEPRVAAKEQWLRFAEALKTAKVFLNAGKNCVERNLSAIVKWGCL
jgi:hypothetical protein